MKPKVLIVEDSENSLELLTAKMEGDGYEVDTARNGIEALEHVALDLPDIILMDVMMPRMDGYETCRRLKANDETRYIPVVMLTARSELEDKVLGLDLGAEDYIVKPYSLAEVSARVRSLLRVRELQARLYESEKLAALGEMVDDIAHEIRNPLVTIGGMARRLYEHEPDEEHKLYADVIIKSVLRLERMMQRIDEYKGVLVSRFEPTDLNDVIEKAVGEARALVKNKEIDFTMELEQAPPPVKMDAGNVRLALLNILQNSIEAIEEKGEISLHTFLSEDNSIVLTITDTGAGMEQDSIKSVFNPFQSSKMTGAGLGLTITHRIIQDHGGSIDLVSKKGEGTTFTLRFKLNQASIAPEPAPQP